MAAINWRALLNADDGYALCPGAATDEIVAAETALAVAFPAALRQLYLASNGVFGRSGQWLVIWPLAEVVIRNRQAWPQPGPGRRELVGFGDDGTGTPFCVPRDGSSGVFAWSAADAEPTLLASSLPGFWSGWTSGTLPPH